MEAETEASIGYLKNQKDEAPTNNKRNGYAPKIPTGYLKAAYAALGVRVDGIKDILSITIHRRTELFEENPVILGVVSDSDVEGRHSQSLGYGIQYKDKILGYFQYVPHATRFLPKRLNRVEICRHCFPQAACVSHYKVLVKRNRNVKGDTGFSKPSIKEWCATCQVDKWEHPKDCVNLQTDVR